MSGVHQHVISFLKKRLSYWIVFLAIVTLIGAVYNISQIQTQIREGMSEAMLHQARGIQIAVKEQLGQEISVLSSMAEIVGNFTYADLTRNRVENPFIQLELSTRDLDAIYMGFEDGSFVSAKDWIPPKSFDPRKRSWYSEARAVGKVVIGDVYTDWETDQITVTFSTPFQTVDDHYGVIAMDVHLSTLNTRLKQITRNSPFNLTIVDGAGRFVHDSTDPFLAGENISKYSASEASNLHEIMKRSQSPASEIVQSDSSKYRLISKVPQANWMIGIYADQELFLAMAEQSIRQHYLINGLLMILALLSVYMFYHMEEQLKINHEDLQRRLVEIGEANRTIEQINQQLELKSNTDGLTRIYNRGYFDEALERYWSMAMEQQVAVGLILIDVDFFKRYNDRYGHIAGDQVLIRLCREFGKHLTQRDVLSRYGGEEFGIVAYDVSETAFYEVADQLNRAVRKMEIVHEDSLEGFVTISAGVNVFKPTKEDTIGNFIHKADLALYEAKMTGRNKVILYSGKR